ncbi:competence type IV pilus ATPase ComGA [Vagococcus vulneris]|nr:competence type IV pilus ATPase ComGA [Vagococcus vulneris]
MSVKKMARRIILQGEKQRISDIYVLPAGKEEYQISFRYHQQTSLYQKLSVEEGERLILYFKYLGGMDVSEKRRVQVGSGKIKLTEKHQCRIRLSTVADFMNRETLVIRLLYDWSKKADLKYLLPNQRQQIKRAVGLNGLYLFSGPTGAGKSTTMYLLAKHLQRVDGKQVITIEDPVEIEDTQFLQCQVNEAIGLTYFELIKVCLRHRPDLLIIGEIRDKVTAEMAIRAALTGHLVFSTVHAKDKHHVVDRLVDLGVSKLELTECLRGIIYQELIKMKDLSYAVLYDMTFDGVEVANWEKSLQQAYDLGKITQKTQTRYLV